MIPLQTPGNSSLDLPLLLTVGSLRNFLLQTLLWVRRGLLYMLANHGPPCTEAAVNYDSVVLPGLGILVLLVHTTTHFSIVLALSCPYNISGAGAGY